MRVEVSMNDIYEGKPHDCQECPIARAIRRIFIGCGVEVDFEWAIVEHDGKRTTYVLPDVASSFVIRFDQEKQVEPITFEMTELLSEI